METHVIDDDNDKDIQLWQTKKLIKYLSSLVGSGTSMISIIMPPGDQVPKLVKKLTDEYGTASNIKSRVNRQSVLDAITRTQVHLKTIRSVPPNGLVIFCGTTGEKEIKYIFEPHKPIKTSLYLCDCKFHTEYLDYLFESENNFGFIIMDGSGALFGTLTGSTRNILHQFSVDLPKKHGRGGQSALRFARIRMEKRHNYVRKVAETAVQMFIIQDKVTVTGLILAGSADFKTELGQSDMFDPRLQAKIIKTVDVSYGGDTGFNQAIELSAESLQDVKFIQEKKHIMKFFDEIHQDTGKFCFGVDETFQSLERGACDTLLIWEDLKISRAELRNPVTNQKIIKYVTQEQENKSDFIKDETGADLELINKELLTDWFAENYKKFGTTLHLVSDRTQEGAQFCRGFGGIGGTLRYRAEFEHKENVDDVEENIDSPY